MVTALAIISFAVLVCVRAVRHAAAIGLAAMLGLWALANPASATVYDINLEHGAASIHGTITTDSVTGVLKLGVSGESDITGWNFLVNDGVESASFLGPNYTNGFGDVLTATSTGLFFNFGDQTPGAFLIFFDPTGNHILCFDNAAEGCSGSGLGPGLDVYHVVGGAQRMVIPEPLQNIQMPPMAHRTLIQFGFRARTEWPITPSA